MEAEFDYSAELNELRTHTSEWLAVERETAVREQRRWRMRELAVTAVLDERGAIDDALAAADGVTVRSVRETVATARALEDLPNIAAAAYSGALSDEQLAPAVRLADPASDEEWARRAPNTAPMDLARLARTVEKPSMDDARARRAARSLGFWWNRDGGMLDGRFSLPDVDGAVVESVLNRMIDQMKPAKGHPWDKRARRAADALVQLCENYADVHAVTGPTPHLVVEVPLSGPAAVAGIPLPDAMVQTLRTRAKIEPILVDPTGAFVAAGTTRPALSPKITRAVLLRDGHCRILDCTCTESLEVMHLWPSAWGGTDSIHNLIAVCTGNGNDHQHLLAPHGPYLLLGNPNDPNGLTLIHRDDLPRLAALAAAEANAHQAA